MKTPVSSDDLSLFKGAFTCVTIVMPHCDNDLERPIHWTLCVVFTTCHKIRSLEGNIKKSVYNLADLGLLRFQ